jgi:hypothetical protein
MKKSKRILSLALVATMTLGAFSMSASAAGNQTSANIVNGTNAKESTPITELPIYKSVKINAGAAIPSETFTLRMRPATEDEVKDQTVSGMTVYQGVELEEGEGTSYVEYSFDGNIDTTSNTSSQVTIKGENVITGYEEPEEDAGEDAEKTPIYQGTQSIDLSGLTFPNTGIYRYYVSEDTSDLDPYIDADEGYYMVDLYVYSYSVLTCTKEEVEADEENGVEGHTHDATCYTDQYKVGHVGVVQYTKEGKELDKPTEIRFTNTLNVANVEIRKIVKGEEFTKDEEFTFYLKIPKGGDTIYLEEGTPIYGEIYNITTVKDDTTQEDKEVRTKDSDVTIYVKGDNDAEDMTDTTNETTSFTLKKDQVLVLSCPVTMVFYVEEADVTDEDYIQYYEYEESGKLTSTQSTTLGNNTKEPQDAIDKDGNCVVVKGTVNHNGTKVTYTNTRIVNVATGVSVDLIPYVLVMLIAVCGAVLFISKKRRIAR